MYLLSNAVQEALLRPQVEVSSGHHQAIELFLDVEEWTSQSHITCKDCKTENLSSKQEKTSCFFPKKLNSPLCF